MEPNVFFDLVNDFIQREHEESRSRAVEYIQNNIHTLESDVKKFIKDCPADCVSSVCSMLMKAGIEIPESTFSEVGVRPLYKWSDDARYWQTSLTDYKQTLSQYITTTIERTKSRLYDFERWEEVAE